MVGDCGSLNIFLYCGHVFRQRHTALPAWRPPCPGQPTARSERSAVGDDQGVAEAPHRGSASRKASSGSILQGHTRRPGRRQGKGRFSYRKPPSADDLTEPIIEVSVAGESCPGCGGILEHEGVSYAYVTDIPPTPRPDVKGYRVQICRCQSCGKRVRGRHQDIAPDQYGASAHRVGKRVMAIAHLLHYGLGLTQRKVPAVLRTLTGVKISQSAITQDALRRARGEVGNAYHRLRGSVRSSSFVHTDDTGWRVGGDTAYPDDVRDG